jgi:hypothetical protein
MTTREKIAQVALYSYSTDVPADFFLALHTGGQSLKAAGSLSKAVSAFKRAR